ncbi:glycerol kinase GlpK [Paenibacillus sp. OV219]|uniref:FGGY family carbohydrate kinase n=1 Tax=Paenibacillus sp. OV219 TaxID=1884377 RepID=UPI0008ACEDC1|nr:glycerol kinase GlpK [Paenibacillus sp. OV219]SEN80733.1 glycerol kinase [Paenibacillus sp. OV219]
MTQKLLLAIDQGTTGTKVLLLNAEGRIISQSYQRHTQYYPLPGWAQHDSKEIWSRLQQCVSEALKSVSAHAGQIEAVGLSNQGETSLFWDNQTGEPISPAILWSCKRSLAIAERWSRDGRWPELVGERTGLNIDPYFSATKIRWMMDEIPEVREAIRQGRARCSTLDSWLINQMTGNKGCYVTDSSTAARTLLFDIQKKQWDPDITGYLEIDIEWLPEVLPSVHSYGVTDPVNFCGIQAPVLVSMVDQPASLYGHRCLEPGMTKCTYGTGCFVYMNTGSVITPTNRTKGLLSTIAWEKNDNEVTYALDGGVLSAGSALDWARDELGLYGDLGELNSWSDRWYNALSERNTATLNHEVMFIPALSGLAAPHWNPAAAGMFLGLTLHSDKETLTRAILEGIAHSVTDVMDVMKDASGRQISVLCTDGGLSQSDYLMQFQADISGIPVERKELSDTTALGIAYLLGEACGWWTYEEITSSSVLKNVFEPRWSSDYRGEIRYRWQQAMQFLVSFKSKTI